MTKSVIQIIFILIFFAACSSTRTAVQRPSGTEIRKTAQEQEGQEAEARMVQSKKTMLYSWTSSSLAIQDPKAYVAETMKEAQACLPEIASSSTPIDGCEGEQMAAGPGLYTVDDPFTSSDYGEIVVLVTSQEGKAGVISAPYEPMAGSGISREIIGKKEAPAILYDFRVSDFNTKALVIRNESFIQPQAISSIRLAQSGYKKFKDHAPSSCNNETAVAEVLRLWGDQWAFLVFTFFSLNDNLGQNFLDSGELNTNAYLAAFASDAVAVSDSKLIEVANSLKEKFPEMEESLSPQACAWTQSISLRSCLARRIFDSARNELGFGDKTTYAWDVPLAAKALVSMGLLKAQEIKGIDEPEEMSALIAARMKSQPAQRENIKRAFQCMTIVKTAVAHSHLGHWDPN